MIWILIFALITMLFPASSIQAEEPLNVITLPQAQSLALMKNPELTAFTLEIRAKEGQAIQAGLLPNPEISFTVENFGGSGDLHGFKGTETTLQISQMVELGGKLSKRRYVATLERNLANWDFEAKRADVLSEVTKAFIEVLSSQESLALTEELVSLSEEVFNTISARVKAAILKWGPLLRGLARFSFILWKTKQTAEARKSFVQYRTG